MRIWDLRVEHLRRNHLLAGHQELHAIWSIALNNKRGYSRRSEPLAGDLKRELAGLITEAEKSIPH